MNVALVYRGRYHIREALDLETLASLLRMAGHKVRFVYDPDTFGVTDNVLQIPTLARWLADDQDTLERILDARPDVVIFSVLSSTYAWCRQMADALKAKTSAPVVFRISVTKRVRYNSGYRLLSPSVATGLYRAPSVDPVSRGRPRRA